MGRQDKAGAGTHYGDLDDLVEAMVFALVRGLGSALVVSFGIASLGVASLSLDTRRCVRVPAVVTDMPMRAMVSEGRSEGVTCPLLMDALTAILTGLLVAAVAACR